MGKIEESELTRSYSQDGFSHCLLPQGLYHSIGRTERCQHVIQSKQTNSYFMFLTDWPNPLGRSSYSKVRTPLPVAREFHLFHLPAEAPQGGGDTYQRGHGLAEGRFGDGLGSSAWACPEIRWDQGSISFSFHSSKFDRDALSCKGLNIKDW